MKGKAHLPLQIQIRRERLFRQVTSKHWAAEDGPARWEGLMCPGKLGKCLSSHPSVCQEQCLALLGMESGLPQAQGASGHTAPHKRGAALPLTTDMKLNHHSDWTSGSSLKWENTHSHHVHSFVTFPPNVSSSKRKKLQILVVCI